MPSLLKQGGRRGVLSSEEGLDTQDGGRGGRQGSTFLPGFDLPNSAGISPSPQAQQRTSRFHQSPPLPLFAALCLQLLRSTHMQLSVGASQLPCTAGKELGRPCSSFCSLSSCSLCPGPRPGRKAYLRRLWFCFCFCFPKAVVPNCHLWGSSPNNSGFRVQVLDR